MSSSGGRFVGTACTTIGAVVILAGAAYTLLGLVGFLLVLLASMVGNAVQPPGWADALPLLYGFGIIVVGVLLTIFGLRLRKT